MTLPDKALSTISPHDRPMRILIVSDAWEPQVNGVVRTLQAVRAELPEVLGLSDRVLVMHEGKLKANLVNHNLTQENVMEAALRSERHVEKQSV